MTSRKHTPAPPDRIAHLRAVLRIIDPFDALGDAAAAPVAKIIATQSGKPLQPGVLTMILRGERTASEAKIAGWEAHVRAWVASRPSS